MIRMNFSMRVVKFGVNNAHPMKFLIVINRWRYVVVGAVKAHRISWHNESLEGLWWRQQSVCVWLLTAADGCYTWGSLHVALFLMLFSHPAEMASKTAL